MTPGGGRRSIANCRPPNAQESALTQIAITKTASPKQPPADETLAFGRVFTDHMFLMDFHEGKGWHDPRMLPYGPFTLGPAVSYDEEGMNTVSILASDAYVRAVQGGLGAAKTAGNYAASLFGAEEAQKAGYTQVLWLDGVEHKYLDEVGTMNIMLKIGDEVITPPLNGAILDGITRDSVLTLLHDWGMRVSERPVAIDEVIAAAQAGRLEVWGTGTAAGISPVGELGDKGRGYGV